ncbi:hypothetical protein ABIA33_002069 [Streptacidiphilus sp. MAP12-16]|uniref:DUF3592 domain-containing protein n=1 Tax=Streptacidiphilus sp. MAP12-16 TaxID=3156300 RepID=UPI0035126E7F
MSAFEGFGVSIFGIAVLMAVALAWAWVWRRRARRCEGVVVEAFTARTAAPPTWTTIETRRVRVRYTDQGGRVREFREDSLLDVGAKVTVLHSWHWPRVAQIGKPAAGGPVSADGTAHPRS